eukprot:8923837-Pyramimonas_sp.AAC.1
MRGQSPPLAMAIDSMPPACRTPTSSIRLRPTSSCTLLPLLASCRPVSWLRSTDDGSIGQG